MSITVIVMAAGKGTRMKSERPKVLHRLAGRSLLQHVLDAAAALGPSQLLIVTGHAAESVEKAARGPNISFVRQEPQLGTGHAVQQTLSLLPDEGTVLVLNGDVPLVRPETAQRLVDACEGKRLALLTVELEDPTGYGRVIRGDAAGRDALEGGRIHAIVEHKDANPMQRKVREVYTGMLAAPAAALKRWVASLDNQNAQQEYYLTDVVALAVLDRVPVVAAHPRSVEIGRAHV
jgi:bifunctional UDP-N-acetylglucosamine pyrophosphorylase/glucosamine-1-phosphate N-acetyltransferase